jgi:MATE family multidrug resistance protein
MAHLGAIAIGTQIFNLIYWNFGFLRMGTSGFTAQAYGARDMAEAVRIFVRAITLALVIALLLIVLQWPIAKLSEVIFRVDQEPRILQLALAYFFVRIWAAPATLGLYAVKGWFIGMQDSVRSMWADLVVNVVNIVASIVLALGIGGWEGLGFDGIALGTVIAQYSGLAYSIIATKLRYGGRVFGTLSRDDLRGLFNGTGSFMRMNLDYFGRSVFFMVIYIGYTMIAAKQGDLMLACSSIMMQLLMLFSYFTDGFAYAGEALTGRFIGAKDREGTVNAVKYVFVWSMAVAVAFVGIYLASGVPLLRLMTDDGGVVEACRRFLPWLILMPPLGCAAFTWDGIYLGATASRGVFLAMAGAAVSFIVTWLACRLIFNPEGPLAIHCLLAAYFAHLIFRTVYLSARYRKDILGRWFA